MSGPGHRAEPAARSPRGRPTCLGRILAETRKGSLLPVSRPRLHQPRQQRLNPQKNDNPPPRDGPALPPLFLLCLDAAAVSDDRC